jgi:hypothetical protein
MIILLRVDLSQEDVSQVEFGPTVALSFQKQRCRF